MKFANCAPVLAVLALLSGLTTPTAAQGRIRWISKDYDFGLMKEIAGPKTGESVFVNTGRDTLAIVEVRPSCGCTSAEFTEEAIAPGDTARVRYTYDPKMRPGKFDKSVHVRLSDGSRETIRIRGNVLGTPESLATLYPVEAGTMRLSESVLDFGTVTYGRTPLNFVNAYSVSLDSIHPTATPRAAGLSPSRQGHKSNEIVIKQSAATAGPGDLVTFTVGLDTQAADQYGPVIREVEISDGNSEGGVVELRAFVVPDQDWLRLHQQGKTPMIELSAEHIDLNAIEGTARLTREIGIANTGKGELEVLAATSPSSAVRIVKVPQKIKQGKRGIIRIEIDPAQLTGGAFRTYVDLVTNDPLQPHKRIAIAGNK